MAAVHVKQEPQCPPAPRIKQEPRDVRVAVKSEPVSSSSARIPSRVNDGASTSAVTSTTPLKSSSTTNNKSNRHKVNSRASTSPVVCPPPPRISPVNLESSSQRINDGASSSTGRTSAPDFIPLTKRRAKKKSRRSAAKKRKLQGGENKLDNQSGRVEKKKQKFKHQKVRRSPRQLRSNFPMSFSAQSEPNPLKTEPNLEPKEQPSNEVDVILVLSDSEVEIVAEVPRGQKPVEEVIVVGDAEETSNKENIQQGGSTAAHTLRPIVIDGSNVAMAHGLHSNFSWRGIQICIDYFLTLGHQDIKVFVPEHRKCGNSDATRQLIEHLERAGLLIFTPSRSVNGKRITSEDDRFIIEYATKSQGVIVSRDQYRDMMAENVHWRETIEKRLLQFTFAGDIIMFPVDPLGRHGPHLSQFLRFP